MQQDCSRTKTLPPPRYKTVTHRFEMKNDESILPFLTLVLTKNETVTTLALIWMKIKGTLPFKLLDFNLTENLKIQLSKRLNKIFTDLNNLNILIFHEFLRPAVKNLRER